MGSHTGCEHGVCGACTVRVDGKIVRGCLVLAASLDGAKVETIEGVSDTGEIRDLQDAFIARNACQCGYCTPGMLLTAAELLTTNPQPTREEIREHLSGNYCRCTGYHAIVDAVETAAAQRNAEGPGHERDHRSRAPSTGPIPTSASRCRGRMPGSWSKAAASTSTTSCCRAWCTSPSCAARTRTPRFCSIDAADALKLPGVLRVFTGAISPSHCEPWVAVLAHLKGMKSAPQLPLPLERATWVGEAVAAVVAESRAVAEDAVAKVDVDYEPLPAAVDMETALDPARP